MAAKGIMTAYHFLGKYAAPNKAIAAMGVKFQICGTTLLSAANTMITKARPIFQFKNDFINRYILN
jgi:intracellular sulfur oxidation DsrE/DsrF family protein